DRPIAGARNRRAERGASDRVRQLEGDGARLAPAIDHGRLGFGRSRAAGRSYLAGSHRGGRERAEATGPHTPLGSAWLDAMSGFAMQTAWSRSRRYLEGR